MRHTWADCELPSAPSLCVNEPLIVLSMDENISASSRTISARGMRIATRGHGEKQGGWDSW